MIASPDGTYEAEFLAALEKVCARDVRRIYFGHGPPLTGHCNERLRESQRMAVGGWPPGSPGLFESKVLRNKGAE